MIVETGFHLKNAADLSSEVGPPLRPNLPYRGLQRAATERDDKNTYLDSRWELLKDFYKGLPKS